MRHGHAVECGLHPRPLPHTRRLRRPDRTVTTVYAALWRILPGPTWLKALECLVIAGVVCWVLLTWVFPWVEPMLPFDRIVIGEE